MKKELSIKQIYDDFTSKVILNETEKDVLNKYIKNESIVKISTDLSISTASISRIIADIKNKYNNYKKLELVKLKFFQQKND